MASLLKLALEGSLGGIFGHMDTSNGADNQSGQPTAGVPEASEGSPTKDTSLVLRGPLAHQFSEALARLFNKHAPEKIEDSQEEAAQTTAPETAATESQANDALGLQELANNIRIMSEAEAEDNSTTVYGVDAADVKPEDIVEVSQAADQGDDLVVVMTQLPGEGGEEAEPSAIARALESLCESRGIRLYPSYETYGQACLEQDQFALEGIFTQSDADKLQDAKLKRITKGLEDMVTRIANALEAAIKKGWTVKLSGSNDDYKIIISALDEKSGKRLYAKASVN
jgi:hypothetical protein